MLDDSVHSHVSGLDQIAEEVTKAPAGEDEEAAAAGEEEDKASASANGSPVFAEAATSALDDAIR